ncbi:GHKL domain-containing protein [Tenacibaculum sp. MAR_2009_124]|uniref:sensor histidine kinase n=1 Tax=Tenacibaculum sp. MAR_2009_124 TaxID=1250059 RepID=UPI000899845E|nr:histidine kinase [Tenacibaculum sp. MAR_2009_124]SEB46712.1 GHKL domain-containing protein [Tenacibaculum sp. MAR_2009_124]
MTALDKLIDNKIVQNVFAWLLLLIIFTMIITADNTFLTALIFIAFIIPPVYISNLKILPLFFKKKEKLGVLFYILNICFFTFIGVAVLSDFFKKFEFRMLINVFGAFLLIIIFGTALKLSRDSFIRRQKEKEAELKLLKAQLNPHFLFNTLNNLYGLSVIKSDKLPSLMLQLSDLLRYSLYDTRETFVSLEKEVSYLENYISLERIRLEDEADIEFHKSGNFSEKKIAPMLLIVFVENCFKHLGEQANGKSEVSISLKESNDSIIFECNNTLEKEKTVNNMEKGKSGIGLNNVRKRLDLIYPDQHELHINKVNNNYSVQLIINL